MPTYEYRCKDCGHEFERVEHLSEHEAKHECPKMGIPFTPVSPMCRK